MSKIAEKGTCGDSGWKRVVAVLRCRALLNGQRIRASHLGLNLPHGIVEQKRKVCIGKRNYRRYTKYAQHPKYPKKASDTSGEYYFPAPFSVHFLDTVNLLCWYVSANDVLSSGNGALMASTCSALLANRSPIQQHLSSLCSIMKLSISIHRIQEQAGPDSLLYLQALTGVQCQLLHVY